MTGASKARVGVLRLMVSLVLVSNQSYGAMPPVDARALALNCATCHSGRKPANGIPSLSGYTAADMERRLLDFKYGRTPATLMNRIAKAYTDQELATLATYLADHEQSTTRR